MLYLGRLSREKGVLTLVHAFEKAAPVILIGVLLLQAMALNVML